MISTKHNPIDLAAPYTRLLTTNQCKNNNKLKKRELLIKTNFFLPLSTNLCFNNSKLFLHLKWYLTIMPVNIYLNKRFFPHDFTLIASVVGESVIGHGIGGILIPVKWRNLLKASCWSKQQQKLVTQSYSHANRLMALRPKYVYTPLSMGNSYAEYPPPRWLKYCRYVHRNQYVHMRNLDRTSERSNRQQPYVRRLLHQRSHSKVMGAPPSQ